MQTGATKVAVIGSGSWGTTLAILAHNAGSACTLLVRNRDTFTSMTEERRHSQSIPGVMLPPDLIISQDYENTLANADVVILAVPTQKMRAATYSFSNLLQGKIVASAAKGIEIATSLLPTQIVSDVCQSDDAMSLCAISGPNLAAEIAAGKPATTVIASQDLSTAITVQNVLIGPSFRVYTSTDIVGVQVGGALKNIIAIGAGISDGLQAGDNAKAAFMTRGIAEIARLGIELGADPLTFAGLSGIGDLMCTCSSNLSRNHQVGVRLAGGESLDEILITMNEVAEGIDTTRATVAMARERGIEMPIAEEMYRVLFEDKSPVDAIHSLMNREPRHEQI